MPLLDMAAWHAALFQILLMIFLRAPEFRSRSDFRDNPPLELPRPFELFLGRARRGFLLGRVEKYCGAILLAVIGPLTIELRGVVVFPEDFKNVRVGNVGGVERDLHNFRVSGLVSAHILISGILQMSAHISHDGGGDSVNLAESRLHSPETACSKCRSFCWQVDGPPLFKMYFEVAPYA